MTRPSEHTRQNILRAAVDLFAEKGFDGASVRAMVTRARVNQAAINYHFNGKEGLYLAVLELAFDRVTREEGRSAAARSREDDLRAFIDQQLRPLLSRDDMSRYLRIFAWESVRPSEVMRRFLATNAAPYMSRANDLVRRFLPPHATDSDVTCAVLWLVGQCSIFVRNRAQFTEAPFNLKIDEAFVAHLSETIAALALRGLARSTQ